MCAETSFLSGRQYPTVAYSENHTRLISASILALWLAHQFLHQKNRSFVAAADLRVFVGHVHQFDDEDVLRQSVIVRAGRCQDRSGELLGRERLQPSLQVFIGLNFRCQDQSSFTKRWSLNIHGGLLPLFCRRLLEGDVGTIHREVEIRAVQ